MRSDIFIVNGTGHGDGFENGSGFVWSGNDFVLVGFKSDPVFEPFVDVVFSVFVFDHFAHDFVAVMGDEVAVEPERVFFTFDWDEGFNLFWSKGDFFCSEGFAEVVWVEAWVMGHGHDAAGVWIHDNHLSTVGAVSFDGSFKHAFDGHLHGAVDGEDDVVTVLGGFDHTVAHSDLAAINTSVALGLEDTFFPLELGVVFAFDTVLPESARSDETESIGCEFGFWVEAIVFLLESEPEEVFVFVFVHDLANLGRDFWVDFFGEDDVTIFTGENLF